MWNDIIIGQGKEYASAHRVIEGVSENPSAYWINKTFFGVGLTIYKDTPEGKMLTKMLQENQDVQDWLDELVLKHCNVKTIKAKFEEHGEKRFQEGKRAKVNEINKVLGLD